MKTQTTVRREANKSETYLFATANIGNNAFFSIISTFIMFYFTNILGIKPMVAGTIFMVSRLVDALTDPLMGFILDHTNSKRFGKYRGYVQIGAPFLGIVFVVLFTVPNLGMGGKIAYAYLVYILYSLVWTVVQIPVLTFPMLMSQSASRRTKIMSLFQACGGIVAAMSTLVVYKLLDVFGGREDPHAWTMMAICVAIFATLMQEIAMFAVRKLDVYDPQLKETQELEKAKAKQEKVPLRDRVGVITRNVALIALVISFGTDMFANQITSNTTTYFFIYNLGGRTQLQGLLGVVALPTMIVLAFIAEPLTRKFGKKKVILFCETVCIVCNLIMIFTGGTSIPVVVATGITGGVMFGVTNMMCRSALLDVAGYTKMKTGKNVAGLMSSSFTFVNKLVQSFGAFFAGWFMEVIAFDTTAATQTPEALRGLLLVRCIVPIAAQVATLIAMRWYPITREVEAQMSVIPEQKAEAAE